MSTRIDRVGQRCTHMEQPGLVALKNWAIATYGGTNLGIYACRNVRNGTGRSVHSEGRAWDWLAPSRGLLDALFGVLIRNADALGVQAIHDYDRGLRWEGARGWHRANIGPAPHHNETHIELNWGGARDTRSIPARIGAAPLPGPAPPSNQPPSSIPPVTVMEEDDVLLESDIPKSNDPNRPAVAELRRADKCVILYNNAALGGDQAVFGVRVRYLTEIKGPVAGWRPVPGGVQVLDVAGAAFTYVWT